MGGVVAVTFASHAESPGFKSGRMQVVQSPSSELVQLRLEIHALYLLELTPKQLVHCFGTEYLRVTENEIIASGNPFSWLTWPCILVSCTAL